MPEHKQITTPFFTMKAFDNLLFVESLQSWNEDVVLDFVTCLKDLVLDRYLDKPWAVLHDARKWGLGTPETVDIVSRFLSVPLTGTFTHHALVTGSSEMIKWQAGKYLESVSHFETKIFEDIQDAEGWLFSKGYKKS